MPEPFQKPLTPKDHANLAILSAKALLVTIRRETVEVLPSFIFLPVMRVSLFGLRSATRI